MHEKPKAAQRRQRAVGLAHPAIRLLDLVTQTSGLPWDVPRPPSSPEDPFATNTSDAQLAALEDGDPFLFAPGTAAMQSNFGFGLLGLALRNAAGRPYTELLRERVLDGLGMADTTMPPPRGRPPYDAGPRLRRQPLPAVPTSPPAAASAPSLP